MGIQIFNSDGSLFFETGAHVLTSVPGFTEEIGKIAATWAVAEGHLGCYYAVLLETTPDDALKQLGKQGASQVTKNSEAIAKEKLSGNELVTLLDLLNKLDSVRNRRNRVQHDIWSRRAGEAHILYAVHVDDYRRLFLEMAENAKDTDQAAGADRSITAANKYAANAANAFTLESLKTLRTDIELVSTDLIKAFFEKLNIGG
ncbi:hypothetical protein NOF55_22815 [Rhizobiaceae bacterium BDR2-2]|uniref:Uncharacterized protein n=1 Tax=Ectorhizobium quercum TaxID=2965071 RepID=A0AAE3N4W4_9HYPH|nr:hypothetical protein [Ectorhizobium quercum]MCX8999942.1 hypothetical protein [Ectorhizobium quercum]